MSESESKPEHTPGPWMRTKGPCPSIVADGGKTLIVANVNARVDAIGGQHLSEIFANARLIASAPRLLDALVLCVSYIENTHDRNPLDVRAECIRDARAAIAEAEGGK